MDALRRHLLDRDDVGALAERARGVDHLREAAGIVLHQHVGKQERERLVPDEFARAPYRVAKPERQLLAREARGAGPRQVAGERVEIGAALTLGQGMFEFELAVEMVLDHRLVAAGHEDEVLDAGFARLVDHVLDQRPVDHRQHLLRHRLGGGEEAGAEAGDREDGFANRFHAYGHSSDKAVPPTRAVSRQGNSALSRSPTAGFDLA